MTKPQPQAMDLPPFKEVRGATSAPGGIMLRMVTEKDDLVDLKFRREIVVSTIMTMLNEAAALPIQMPTQASQLQPLEVAGLQIGTSALDEPALLIRFENGLELALILKKDAIGALRVELAKLDEITDPPKGKNPH